MPQHVTKLFRQLLLSSLLIMGVVLNPLMATDAHALGGVSRACQPLGANESITVDWWFNSYWMYTFSDHYNYGSFLHELQDGWTYSWRSYAGHFFEYWANPYVIGYHYYWTPGTGTVYLGNSAAGDCNLANWGG